MTLHLYFHPLSSFCQKALIALYENDTPFVPHIIDLGDPASRAELTDLWPLGKFPVLRDAAYDRIIPESTIIIEYLAQHYPGPTALVPADPDQARLQRLRDRFFDLYVELPMQRIVADALRPPERRDSFGVEQARAALRTAYGLIEQDIAGRDWAMGEAFGMADCAAAPALFFANKVAPFEGEFPGVSAYFQRLSARPSYARVLRESEPYLAMFPA